MWPVSRGVSSGGAGIVCCGIVRIPSLLAIILRGVARNKRHLRWTATGIISGARRFWRLSLMIRVVLLPFHGTLPLVLSQIANGALTSLGLLVIWLMMPGRRVVGERVSTVLLRLPFYDHLRRLGVTGGSNDGHRRSLRSHLLVTRRTCRPRD